MKAEQRDERRPLVLVVEGEPELAVQLTSIVRALGFTSCPSATSVDEALQHAHAYAPDAVLIDVHLAGEADGVLAAERLRQELDLRVVYLADERDHALLERSLQTLPYGYVHKPLRTFDVRCCLTLALHQRRLERAHEHAAALESSPLLKSLSARELAVLRLIALGHTSKDIARVLSIAKPTVDTYRRRITEKLGIRERTDLVRFATQAGLTGRDHPRSTRSVH